MHLPIKLAAGTVLAFTAAGTAQEVTVASWGDSHRTAQLVQLAKDGEGDMPGAMSLPPETRILERFRRREDVQLAGWPSNVLVGFLIGCGIIFLSEKAYDRLKKHVDYNM
ncbi:hypothetical protein [Stappia indica]|uniref:hypothetical protein n=1 Tax=Stappia indica TaxID=538381 RepID=UPI001CD4B9DB|nr:hypothetical protein [Stappia indica]MCA1299405.1 hypothetical protein [Stappia indica]